MDHLHGSLDETNMMSRNTGNQISSDASSHPEELLNQTLGSTEYKLLKSRTPG